MHGKSFTLRQTTIISTWPTLYTTNVYNFIDPCQSTSFIAITISDVYAFVDSSLTHVTIPTLDDTVSKTYTSTSTIPTCYTQSFTISSAG